MARLGGLLQRRRALPAAVWLCSVALALAVPGVARAEEVFTGQAAAAGATDSTWIDPPAQRAAVCIVDTGNTPNPDTTNVVARFAVDGGSPDDVDTAGSHGTLMSMIASAPYNGWGMVGVAPSINVVSVRAMRPGQRVFYFSDVLKGINLCKNKRDPYNIKVISLSLGGQGSLDGTTQSLLENAIDGARNAGLNVVAAAGNENSGVDWPASYPPVLAVAADDSSGVRCRFSNSGSSIDLFAPGCPMDAALPDGTPSWASGTSESTALIAGVLTQLRGLNVSLAPDQAEGLLTATARNAAAGLTLDVAAAFRAAGLDTELDHGRSAVPAIGSPSSSSTEAKPSVVDGPATSTPTTAAPAVVEKSVARLRAPRVRVAHLRRGLLTVVFLGKPKGVQARVQIYARMRGKPLPTLLRSLRITGDKVRARVSGSVSQVSITYRDPSGKRAESAPLSLHPH